MLRGIRIEFRIGAIRGLNLYRSDRPRQTGIQAHASMRLEEVIHDVFAVVPAHGVESGHACEREGSDELAHGEFDIKVVKLVARLRALKDGVEGLSVLVDHPRS